MGVAGEIRCERDDRCDQPSWLLGDEGGDRHYRFRRSAAFWGPLLFPLPAWAEGTGASAGVPTSCSEMLIRSSADHSIGALGANLERFGAPEPELRACPSRLGGFESIG